MKSTLSLVVAAILVGALAGAAVGFWEARPWMASPEVTQSRASAAPDGENGATKTDAAGEAKAVVAETEFHFGNMESGASQRHSFPVHNAGQRPLTLDYASHSCKCTEVRLNGNAVEPGASIVVPPGGDAEVQLQWAAKVEAGPFRHGATFTTNDPALRRIEIIVVGDIVDSTTLEPSQLAFGSVHVGQQGKAEMNVMAFLEPEVEIVSHEVLPAELAKRVQVAIEPLPADKLPNPQAKAGVRVTATYDPGGMLGQFSGALRLETNLKQAQHLEVPLFGTVVGDISIYSPLWNKDSGILRMKAVRSEEGGVTKLYVNVRGDHADATQLSVEKVTPSELKVTIGEPDSLRAGLVRIPLSVEIPAGTRPMAFAGEDQGGEGEIILATTHPDTAKVRLRVLFTVKP